jgi:hypothetical protein
MAFNNVGPVTYLAPGQSAYWSYSYGGDNGFQAAGADVKQYNNGARHNASDQGKSIDNSGNVQYYVTITNVGGMGAYHNLQGGGAS